MVHLTDLAVRNRGLHLVAIVTCPGEMPLWTRLALRLRSEYHDRPGDVHPIMISQDLGMSVSPPTSLIAVSLMGEDL